MRLHRGTKRPVDLRWQRLQLPGRLYKTRRRNWGCRAGGGLWILDFDEGEGHLGALAAWEREFGPLPGWRVRTARGGLHVYLRGPDTDPRAIRLPATAGCEQGVEIKTKSNQYVVWPGAVFEGREYVPESPRPDPLPDAPPWLVEMASAPPPLATSGGLQGSGGQGGVERERYGTPAEYVAAILGAVPDSEGRIPCPAPDHEDSDPSCQVRGHNLKCWTHPGGPLTFRARQVVAMSLGLGEASAGSWKFDADRAAVDARRDELFPPKDFHTGSER